MKYIRYVLLLVVVLIMLVFSSSCARDPFTFPLDDALVNGRPTLAEFGGRNCEPCKEMWPILNELSREYQGKLNVVIVDVSQHKDLAERFGVVWIPEQLFFDKTGQVVMRHSGTMTKAEMCIQLSNLGIK